MPIVIDKDGVIVAGHTRYLASIELGLDTVPCIVADDLTKEEIKEFRLVDNKVAEVAVWDFGMLEEELQQLDFGGYDFGFPDFGDNGDGFEDAFSKGSLATKFIIPPFSVINTNKGEWRSRKRAWIDKGIRSELGRDGELVYSMPEWMNREAKRD